MPVISFREGEPFCRELQHRLTPAGIAPGWIFDEVESEENQKYIQIFRCRTSEDRMLLFVLNMDNTSHNFKLRFPGLKELAPLGASSEEQPVIDNFKLNKWGWAFLTGHKKEV